MSDQIPDSRQYGPIQPDGWAAPRGYSNGVLLPQGDVLCVAGQIAWDANQQLVGGNSFTAQFDQALANVVAVVVAAGGEPKHIAKLTIYVRDKTRYTAEVREIGARYRERMGKVFPAMALVEVAGLLEPGALVEIEALAVLPPVK